MPLLLVAHPSPDVYGSDLQLLQTVVAARAGGWDVCVTVPADGPLVALLEAEGARVVLDARTAVLRKSALSPRGLLGLLARSGRNVVAGVGVLRRTGADVLLVNTMTVPAWIVAGRLARVPVVCHVHEAENRLPSLLRRLLVAPLRLARPLVANSQATAQALTSADAALSRHLVVVHNGVPDAPSAPTPPRAAADDVARLVVVGRLSPRKGTDVALAAVALLRARGHRVVLDVCGTAFAGYEWFARELETRAAQPDLAGAVTFHGYVSPTRPFLDRADVVLVPSLGESFGNVAVEALLAQRPLVASAAQGLEEIVRDGQTGLLVPPGDAAALAHAVEVLLADPERARALALAGRADALERFGTDCYHDAIRDVLAAMRPETERPAVAAARPPRARVPRVHVAIPTFRRPAMLRDAVGAVVAHLDRLPDLASRTEILVVDNSPDGDARATAAALGAAHPQVPVRYVHEPRPGIGAARARAVAEADPDGLVVFIDDDGLPGERWLEPLVETWERTGAELVSGAILPGYAEPPSAWLVAGGFFERTVPPTGAVRRSAPSGNLLIDVAGVAELGVAFDPERGLRGGEDTLFTRGVTEAGGRIVSCAEAEVVDLVPVERTTRRWLVARVYGHANNAVAIEAHFARAGAPRARVHAEAVARGVVVTVRGAVRWLAARATRDERADARAWLDLARGPGLVTGGLGSRHEAYRR